MMWMREAGRRRMGERGVNEKDRERKEWEGKHTKIRRMQQ
jgi:hypothetical protein